MKNSTEQKQDITELIKSWEDVLAYNGETQEQFDHRTQFDDQNDKDIKVWKAICLALNEGELLKYDGKTHLYFPYLYSAGSGSGFSFYDCTYDDSFSYVGSRLCLKESRLAIHAGKTFTPQLKAYLVAA